MRSKVKVTWWPTCNKVLVWWLMFKAFIDWSVTLIGSQVKWQMGSYNEMNSQYIACGWLGCGFKGQNHMGHYIQGSIFKVCCKRLVISSLNLVHVHTLIEQSGIWFYDFAFNGNCRSHLIWISKLFLKSFGQPTLCFFPWFVFVYLITKLI